MARIVSDIFLNPQTLPYRTYSIKAFLLSGVKYNILHFLKLPSLVRITNQLLETLILKAWLIHHLLQKGF